CATLTGRDYW
nr:immunoglobulin heavy chain junction region [Mus musculus]MBK4189999.1 immunoglobulin heavy chain junction region [Mus musculus]MBK4190000.1 immunoglobulin heavy chain junction region [Mus musculus]